MSKWIGFLCAVTAFGVSLAHADLVDQVDELSPDRAYLLMNKLQAKVFEPVPEGFFTKLSVNVSSGSAFVDPKAYKARLHPNFNDLDHLMTMKVNLLWKTQSAFSFGFMLGGQMGREAEEIAAAIFESVSIRSGFFDLGVSCRLDLDESFFIAPALGVGVIGAGFREETTNDLSQNTYIFRASGIAPHLLVEVPLHYRLNPVWTLNLTNVFQFANVTKLDRIRDVRASVPTLNLSGYQLMFGIGLNL